MDITKEEDIQAAVGQIMAEQGQLDILINNAGFGLNGSVEETKIEDARYQYEVNIFGLARLTQLIIPLMRKRKSGKIINISSVGGKVYTPLGAWYISTKHALEGWSDCLRFELKQFNIDVIVIEPGAIGTEFEDTMVQPMVERSGNGPYKNFVDGYIRFFEKNKNNPKSSSPPSVISNVISKAIKANKPKRRYVAGKYAKQLLFVRNWFGDKALDNALMGLLK